MPLASPLAARLGRDGLRGAGLSFVAGFVDAAIFIALFGLFTAHVTGNFVLLGAELVSRSAGIVAKLLALPVFVLAVAGAHVLALTLRRRGRSLLRGLLAVEAILLVACGLAGAGLSPFGSPDDAAAVLTGLLAVAAMGVQNALGRVALGHLAATTVMTVNVTQAVIDVMEHLRGSSEGAGPNRARLWRMLSAVAAFAAGALAGAFGVAAWSFPCLLLPAAMLAALMLVPAGPTPG